MVFKAHTIHVWYIYVHLVDFCMVNIGKYTMHGCYGRLLFWVFSVHFKFREVIGVDDWSTYLGFLAGTVGLFHLFTRMNPLAKRDEQKNTCTTDCS